MLDSGYWLGKILLERGRLLEAEQIGKEVVALAGRVGDVPRGRNRVTRLTCNVGLHRGNLSEEFVRFERVAAAEEPSDHLQIGLGEDLALWQARAGGAAESAKVLGCPRGRAGQSRCSRLPEVLRRALADVCGGARACRTCRASARGARRVARASSAPQAA